MRLAPCVVVVAAVHRVELFGDFFLPALLVLLKLSRLALVDLVVQGKQPTPLMEIVAQMVVLLRLVV
jgi:hypothetical protein